MGRMACRVPFRLGRGRLLIVVYVMATDTGMDRIEQVQLDHFTTGDHAS